MVVLRDIFLGDYPITQRFGENPWRYRKFGLRGHNGLDFATPMLTPVMPGINGWIFSIKNHPDGYGLHIKVITSDNKYVLVFAHLAKVYVKEKQEVTYNQVIGLTGNSGYTTGPHLHFGLAPLDNNLKRIYKSNGFLGYVNPIGRPWVKWELRNPRGIYSNNFEK